MKGLFDKQFSRKTNRQQRFVAIMAASLGQIDYELSNCASYFICFDCFQSYQAQVLSMEIVETSGWSS